MMIEQRRKLSLLLLVAIAAGLTLLAYEIYLLDLNFEEPCRLLVAHSILAGGEYLVPHILGEIYLNKPPGYNWFVALAAVPFGEVNRFAGRGIAVLSWLLTGGLLFYLTRTLDDYLARVWTVLAGLFPLVIFIEKAALAELDLFFTAVLLIAVAGFFEFYRAGHPDWAWLVGQAFLTLALLTKGPLAYLYFYLPLFIFVLGTERKFGLKGFLGGFLLTHLGVSGWLFGVFQQVPPGEFFGLVWSEAVNRGSGLVLSKYFEQFFLYPVRTLLAFLPWTVVFISLFYTRTRRAVYSLAVENELFRLGLAGLVPGIIFWFHPADRVRYLLPLFPYLALVSGMVLLATRKSLRRQLFKWSGIFLGGLLMVMFFLPKILAEPEGLLNFEQLLAGGVILGFCGIFIVLQAILYSTSTSRLLTVFVVFILAVKMGYLFFYLPQDEPEFFETADKVAQIGRHLKVNGITEVAWASEDQLVVPYYLIKQGIKVNKETGADCSSGWLLTPESDFTVGQPYFSYAFLKGQKFYLHKLKHKVNVGGEKNI